MDALELPRDPATGPHESGFRVDPFLEYDQSPLAGNDSRSAAANWTLATWLLPTLARNGRPFGPGRFTRHLHTLVLLRRLQPSCASTHDTEILARPALTGRPGRHGGEDVGSMWGMLKRHEVETLLKAGHLKAEVARLTGVSLHSVSRMAQEGPVVFIDDAAERAKRRIGRPSLAKFPEARR